MIYSGEDDGDIVNFIEDVVPDDEAHIFDNKREAYTSSSNPEEQEKRRAKLAKSCASLANVYHRSDHRFLFIGFDDSAQFVGIQYLGANGGDHVYDVDDQVIQNILRDHLEPPPSVEKHRLQFDGDKGAVLVIERATSPPIVLTKTVSVQGNRITTQGIAPTRRSSETTHMGHSDFRDIVEHREEVLNQVLQQWVDDVGRVIAAPVNDIEEYEYSITSDPEAPTVRNVVVPEEAKDLNEDLNANTIGWLTDDDLPGSIDVVYKFYCNRDLINESEDDYQRNKMSFLYNASLAHYIPGSEWLSRYNEDWNELFENVLETDYNHWSVLMLERNLLVLGWEDMLRKIADDDRFDYSQSKAGHYADLCTLGTVNRIEEYVGPRIRYGDESYPVSDLYSDQNQLESLFNEIATQCYQGEPAKDELRDVELVRLSKIGSDHLYEG